TVVRRAKVRAALDHLARNLNPHQTWIVTLFAFSASRIGSATAGHAHVAMLLIPVHRPFPNVADHVVQVVAVWRKRADWRSPFVAVLLEILDRKFSLPCIRHHSACGF